MSLGSVARIGCSDHGPATNAIVAAERGYRCVFVCPDKVGQDKIGVLRA